MTKRLALLRGENPPPSGNSGDGLSQLHATGGCGNGRGGGGSGGGGGGGAHTQSFMKNTLAAIAAAEAVLKNTTPQPTSYSTDARPFLPSSPEQSASTSPSRHSSNPTSALHATPQASVPSKTSRSSPAPPFQQGLPSDATSSHFT